MHSRTSLHLLSYKFLLVRSADDDEVELPGVNAVIVGDPLKTARFARYTPIACVSHVGVELLLSSAMLLLRSATWELPF